MSDRGLSNSSNAGFTWMGFNYHPDGPPETNLAGAVVAKNTKSVMDRPLRMPASPWT